MVNDIHLIKIRIYKRTILFGLLLTLSVLLLAVVNKTGSVFDLPFTHFLLFCLSCLILFKIYGARFIRPFEYSGFAGLFGYYFLQFTQEAINGTNGSGLEFRKFLLCLAAIYAFSFLIFPARRAIQMSGLFLACIAVVGVIYTFTNQGKPNFSEDFMMLLQIYASGLIYISLFYVISELKDHYTESKIRSELMTSLADTDALTGAYSRGKTSRLLDSRLEKVQQAEV
jgi:hypothetical protein